MKKNTENQPGGEILLYQTEDGKTRLEVQFHGETVWLSQAQMTELFQTTKQNVSLHIQNIYDERELERTVTVKESLTVTQEGNRRVSRSVEYYNLDVAISVGYRVKSHRGVQLPPFTQEGGLGKVYQLFGNELNAVLETLNKELVA